MQNLSKSMLSNVDTEIFYGIELTTHFMHMLCVLIESFDIFFTVCFIRV